MNIDLLRTLRLISETSLANQRQLSMQLNISLGKINRIVTELQEQQLIEAQVVPYHITTQGMELLKEYRVDSAIILAAGIGERIVPLSFDKPKALLRVKGERLIERLIEQLHEREIYDVTVVIGYMKEKMEYLSDKYGVKLIYNPQFDATNSVTSLSLASSQIRNTYIIPSDVYFTENIFNKYEFQSWIGAVNDPNKPTYWSIETGTNKRVTAIIGDSEATTVNTIYGPSYIAKEEARALSHYVQNDSRLSFKSGFFWENSIADHLKDFPIYANIFENSIIYEFDTFEQLREFDAAYQDDSQSRIISIICDVYNITPLEISDIQTLKKGMTNDSFLFTVRNKRFVFRMPGRGTDALINRKEEGDVYTQIDPLRIADSLYYFNPDTGYKISRFYDGAKPITYDDYPTAFGILRNLHTSNLHVDHEFVLSERIKFYKSLCDDADATYFEDFEEVSTIVEDVVTIIEAMNRPKVLAHIDPVIDNFIKIQDGTIKLIDWEYAAMADPYLDLAMHAIYSGFNQTQIDDITAIYLEEQPTDAQQHLVYGYVALGGFLWALWILFKEAKGENFGTYGLEQYQYARTYGRKFLEFNRSEHEA